MSVIERDEQSKRFDRYLLDRSLRQWELTPLRITAIYLLFGFTALVFSDVLLVQRVSEPLLGQLQALKGGLEVLLTGGLIYALTTTKQAQLTRINEKIGRQNEELLVLHRVLRHNLRNDLNVIMGLGREIGRTDDDETRSRFGQLVFDTGKKMVHYTEQASRIRRVTARHGESVEVDLVDDIPKTIETHPCIDEGVEVEIDLPETAVARTNHMFLEAIEELVRNAVTHNDSDVPEVTVSIDPTAGPLHLVEVSIGDNGSGIPDHVVTTLQESESDQLTHLQGMGLWFVYWVVSESEGHLVIEENERDGTTVRVRVPSARVALTDQLEGAIAVDGE